MDQHSYRNLKKGQLIILADSVKKFSEYYVELRGVQATVLENVNPEEGNLKFKVYDPGGKFHNEELGLSRYDYECVILLENRAATELLKQD